MGERLPHLTIFSTPPPPTKTDAPPHGEPPTPNLKTNPPSSEKQTPSLKNETPVHEIILRKSTILSNELLYRYFSTVF